MSRNWLNCRFGAIDLEKREETALLYPSAGTMEAYKTPEHLSNVGGSYSNPDSPFWRPRSFREIAIMLFKGFLFVQAVFILFYRISPTIAAPPVLRQNQLSNLPPDSWQQYVRAPSSNTVSPVAVLSNWTIGNVVNPNGLLTGTGTILTRNPAAAANTTASGRAIEDITPQIVIDFGQNIPGNLSIEFGGSQNFTPGYPGIRLAFSESLDYGYLTNYSDFSRSDNGDTITPGSDQIAVKSSPYNWTDTHGCEFGSLVCADGFHGFRYVKIYMDALPEDSPFTTAYGSVTINSVSLSFSGFRGTPDTFSGWIQTSDEDLNQWWYDSVYTNDICTDIFLVDSSEPRYADSGELPGELVLMDGAKRDRDPYAGDIAVSGKTSYLTHNLSEAAINVLADLADHQRSDGWIPPASINFYELTLMDYPLWWVVCTYDLYMYTGNTAFVEKYYANMVLTLDTYYPGVTNTTSNLITKGVGSSVGYGDYAFLPRNGAITYYNVLYVLALKRAASIATALGGKSADADRWNSRADLVAAAVNEYNYDPSVGAFFDGTCDDGNPCPTHAQDGNGISIVSGSVTPEIAQSVLDYWANATAQPYGNAFYDNGYLEDDFSTRVYAFISYFEIEARFLIGSADTALEEIRRLYGWMTSHDPQITVWEGIGQGGLPYEGAFTSLAHGWSTGIVPLMTNHILGVTPTGPGFSTWAVQPIPGDVQWAKGVVPGPSGNITVAWNRDESAGTFWLSVSAPASSSGTISVPAAANAQVYHNSQLVTASNGTQNRPFMSSGYVTLEVVGGDHTVTVGYNE